MKEMKLNPTELKEFLASLHEDDVILDVERRGFVVLDKDTFYKLEMAALAEFEIEERSAIRMPHTYVIERQSAFGNDLREHLLDITGLGHSATNDDICNALKELMR